MTRMYGFCLVAIGLIAAAFSPGLAARSASPDVITQDLNLYVGEQQTFTPGYAVGDIQVINPEIANFRVQAGRRELMLVGKGKGDTQLIIWDQKHVKRHELHLLVRSRDEMKAEADLKDLLKDFPSVQVRRLGERLVISGVVSTQNDLDAIGRIASVGSADNLVRLVKPAYPGAPVSGTGASTPAPEGPATPPPPTKASAPPQIEYEVEVIEANIAFQSGTYGKGIEPSGRTLYKQTVRAALGTDTDLTVPGAAITAKPNDKDKKNDKNAAAGAGATSIHLRVRATDISEDGQLTSFVFIETNVPVEGASDPSVTRRARWELVGALDEPFGLAGAELMAMPQVQKFPSRLGRVLGTATQVTGLPGVSGRGGTNYVPSYVPYYDKSKNTQLLAVFRPRLIAPAK
jgi:Flp pilus assembly secretin CpaC